MDYVLHILVLVGIYVILAVSLDLIVGHTGFLSIGHAAFYGIGAYTSALLAVNVGAPFIVGVVCGMLIAVLLSFTISLSALRLHGDYFVIATFAFQMILFNIFNNWTDLTGGAMGVPGIPYPVLLGWHVDSNLEFVALAALIAGLIYLISWRIVTSPFGRVLRAIREDEVVAKAMGKNTSRLKATAFAVSAALAASAGSLYAHYITYIDASSFTVMESILIISMVIIGGAGSLWGPLIGAFVLVTLPEALRFVGLPSSVAANLRQIIYGTLLVVMMMFRPRGLVGTYAFRR